MADDMNDSTLFPDYAALPSDFSMPTDEIPAGEMPRRVAYDLIHDELMLDGNARLNLATFVTTTMEDEASRLMAESFDKNMIDKDEYPRTTVIENRCVAMLSRLWNSPAQAPTGASTIGSSEAAMLAGMALKWRWRARRAAAGLSTDRPNLVMGINVQVCWEKFCRYWDVEARFVPMDGDRFHISAAGAVELCDENTIGVIAIMGSTYDGSYEPVAEICQALDAHFSATGVDVPVHVDAASGGFVAPFLDPDLVWDFRLPRVASINSSGHKFGLVYPGVGWIVWRDRDALPEDLIFYTNYLGGEEPTLALNFSRPGNQVIAQYYNVIRFGREGYTRIQQHCRDNALYLSGRLGGMDEFELITRGDDIPVFAFRLADGVGNYTAFDVSAILRQKGWQVPAYTFPKNREDLTALRVVVRYGTDRDLVDMLVEDLSWALGQADRIGGGVADGGGFRH